MPQDEGGLIRRRRVGGLLRQYRKDARLTARRVAEELDCSLSKITRIELAQVPQQRRDIRDMLDMYGITGERRQEIVDLLGDDKDPGWWHRYHEFLSRKYSNYIAHEAEAACLRTYEPQVIPGLFQTAGYAHRSIHKTLPEATPKDIEARVEVRMARQDLLAKEPPLRVLAVIDEGALRRQVGDRALMRAQYERLIEASDMPNVRIQVLPFTLPSACTTGPFILVEFPKADDAAVGYLENAAGDVWLENAAKISRYRLVFDELCADSFGAEKSVDFIRTLMAET